LDIAALFHAATALGIAVFEGFPPHTARLPLGRRSTSRCSSPVSVSKPSNSTWSGLAAAASRVFAMCRSVPRVSVSPYARGRSFRDLCSLRGFLPVGPRLAFRPARRLLRVFALRDAAVTLARSLPAGVVPGCLHLTANPARGLLAVAAPPPRRCRRDRGSSTLSRALQVSGQVVAFGFRRLRPIRLAAAPQRACSFRVQSSCSDFRPTIIYCACYQRTAGWLASFERCLPPWDFRPRDVGFRQHLPDLHRCA